MNPETIADEYDESAIRRVIKINLILPLVSLAGAAIAILFSPNWSTLIYIAVPFLTSLIKNRIPQTVKSDGL
jgi:hypothetical protein